MIDRVCLEGLALSVVLPSWQNTLRVTEPSTSAIHGFVSRISLPMGRSILARVPVQVPQVLYSRYVLFCEKEDSLRAEGLEPPCLSAPEPKSGASANFATPAIVCIGRVAGDFVSSREFKKKGLFEKLDLSKSPNYQGVAREIYRFNGMKETTIAFDLNSDLRRFSCFERLSLSCDFPIWTTNKPVL